MVLSWTVTSRDPTGAEYPSSPSIGLRVQSFTQCRLGRGSSISGDNRVAAGPLRNIAEFIPLRILSKALIRECWGGHTSPPRRLVLGSRFRVTGSGYGVELDRDQPRPDRR